MKNIGFWIRPNPPGDTRDAAEYVKRFLEKEGLSYEILGPDPEKPNIVSNLECGKPGPSLVLNGHIDVFPVGDGEGWSVKPWGGELVDGRICGRGACDMKAGTTASVMTYAYLHKIKESLRGKLTLTVVSDEESGGRLGAGWITKNVPKVLGDCCLNGEPSSPYTLRFSEKGILWLRIDVKAPGGHGAYTHISPNPIKVASQFILELESLIDLPFPYPKDVAEVLDKGRDAAEKALGSGGAEVMRKLSVNIGTITGGLKVNVIPRECSFEVDIRLPPGLTKEVVLARVAELSRCHPEVTIKEIRYDGPLWSPPGGVMARTIIKNARMLGFDPKPIVSLGGSDLKFWREYGIPSYYYGPTNHGMGTVDEYVEVNEFLHVVKVHTLSAYDYLRGSRQRK